jgi:hypothetical protein
MAAAVALESLPGGRAAALVPPATALPQRRLGEPAGAGIAETHCVLRWPARHKKERRHAEPLYIRLGCPCQSVLQDADQPALTCKVVPKGVRACCAERRSAPWRGPAMLCQRGRVRAWHRCFFCGLHMAGEKPEGQVVGDLDHAADRQQRRQRWPTRRPMGLWRGTSRKYRKPLGCHGGPSVQPRPLAKRSTVGDSRAVESASSMAAPPLVRLSWHRSVRAHPDGAIGSQCPSRLRLLAATTAAISR